MMEEKKFADVGVQVDFTIVSSVKPQQQFVDLGYDSLQSTPRQHQFQQKQQSLQQFDIDEAEDNGSETSAKAAKMWNKKFSKLKVLQKAYFRKKPKRQAVQEVTELTEKEDITDIARLPKEEPEEERLEWSKKIDFLLSIIGFAVDLANVWRFPYLCYKNGGGVFLIPYTTMLVFGALPLFFLELSLGQLTKSGPISVWNKICPWMKGVGYCAVLISWYVSFYYNVIIGWSVYFIIMTLTSGDILPWQSCGNSWNTDDCFAVSQMKDQLTCNVTAMTNCSIIDLSNRTSPAQEFFERGVLQIDKSAGLHDMGSLRPELVGCVLVVFCMLYFSLWKGVKSSGKVVWVTATAPYFILTILLIRGVFLPGAGTGIMYYLNPQLDKLADPLVWVDAAVQVFYSIGVGFGVHLTYASFNKFNNNCYRDCLVTACVNSMTSFYSGFVIFTYLGYMAQSMNKEIENVASEGYGLVFQVYPEAISTLPFAKFWSLLFFFMLITLGLDSAMGGLESVITGLMDEFNFGHIKREYFTIIVLCSSFLGSLINCTQGGGYTMFWMDSYSAGISLLCSAMFEAISVTRFYGLDRFCDGIESMIGHQPNKFWQYSWYYISPLFLLCVIIMSIVTMGRLSYHHYDFPMWATVLGWMLTGSSISAVPIYAAIYWFRKIRNERIQKQNINSTKNEICASTKIANDELIPVSLNSPIYV